MASAFCPNCGYEIPLSDLTYKPILEHHRLGCSYGPGGNDRPRMLDVLRNARIWATGTDDERDQ